MKKVKRQKTLSEQLREVEVNESVQIPYKSYSPANIRSTACRLKEEGYIFRACETLSNNSMLVTRIA